MKRIFSIYNTKLIKDGIVTFNLPPIITCPGASGHCKQICYGQHGCHTFPNVQKAHKANLKLTRDKNFVGIACTEIEKHRYQYVRWHSTGDTYSQIYLEKIAAIAKKTSDTFHYTYTKSLSLNWEPFDRLDNTKRINSFGGLYDRLISFKKPHAKIFDKKVPRNYADCSTSDMKAIKTSIRIGLLKH